LPEDIWLQDKFIKYGLCKSIGLQPSEYDKLDMDEAQVYWSIDQYVNQKQQQDREMEKSKSRSKR